MCTAPHNSSRMVPLSGCMLRTQHEATRCMVIRTETGGPCCTLGMIGWAKQGSGPHTAERIQMVVFGRGF